MKKVAYLLALLLEVAALAGAYAVHYFTVRRMGMVRYVIYKNQGWERDYPMGALTMAGVLVIALLTAAVLILFLKKRKELSALILGMNVVMVILSVLYIGYTLMSSTETMPDYYFLSLLFLTAALVQAAKTAAAVLTAGRKKA